MLKYRFLLEKDPILGILEEVLGVPETTHQRSFTPRGQIELGRQWSEKSAIVVALSFAESWDGVRDTFRARILFIPIGLKEEHDGAIRIRREDISGLNETFPIRVCCC